MFLRVDLSFWLRATMGMKMKRPFGRRRCWVAPLAGWATYWAMPGPGRWMDNRLFMLTAPRCIWLKVMGPNHMSWRQSPADLIGLAGRPTAVGYALPCGIPEPVQTRCGKCPPMAPTLILCLPAGTLRPPNVAA